jgi:aspartyl-tRNA synthetase
MERFGSDKPDTRFGLELQNVSDLVKDCRFKVFANAVANGGSVRAINAKGCGERFPERKSMGWVNILKPIGQRVWPGLM